MSGTAIATPAARIRTGSLAPAALVRAAAAGIEDQSPRLNAVVASRPNEAIDEAAQPPSNSRIPLGPWIAGGSSGREAAAVASGMSLVGPGSDDNGALRWPAQCAALIGLRPTGRIEVFVNGGEHNSHQGPPDGNPLTVIARAEP